MPLVSNMALRADGFGLRLQDAIHLALHGSKTKSQRRVAGVLDNNTERARCHFELPPVAECRAHLHSIAPMRAQRAEHTDACNPASGGALQQPVMWLQNTHTHIVFRRGAARTLRGTASERGAPGRRAQSTLMPTHRASPRPRGARAVRGHLSAWRWTCDKQHKRHEYKKAFSELLIFGAVTAMRQPHYQTMRPPPAQPPAHAPAFALSSPIARHGTNLDFKQNRTPPGSVLTSKKPAGHLSLLLSCLGGVAPTAFKLGADWQHDASKLGPKWRWTHMHTDTNASNHAMLARMLTITRSHTCAMRAMPRTRPKLAGRAKQWRMMRARRPQERTRQPNQPCGIPCAHHVNGWRPHRRVPSESSQCGLWA